jgi:hypothetical protein
MLLNRKDLFSIATAIGISVTGVACSPERVFSKSGNSCSDAIPLPVGSNRWTVRDSTRNGRFEEQKIQWGLKYRNDNFPHELLGRYVTHNGECYYLLGAMPLKETTYTKVLREGYVYVKKP